MNETAIRTHSHGWSVWKRWESDNKERKSLEVVAEETGLGLSTVRKVLAEPDADVSNVITNANQILAAYFGVPIESFVYTVGKPVIAKKRVADESTPVAYGDKRDA